MKFLLALAAIFSFMACQTPYQAKGIRGGYSDQKLSDNVFFVEVEVNGYTSKGTAMKYLHRRAYELCASVGFENFRFKDRSDGENYSVVKNGDNYHVVGKPYVEAVVECY